MAGAALYLVLPKLIAVLGAWPRLSTLNPVWFTVCLAAELGSFICNFALQRLALRTKDWFPVVTAGLSGNAVTSSLPGGSAAGAAVQFRMLTTAGFDTDTAVGGLTAFSLLEVGGLLALHILRCPPYWPGAGQPGLVHTALLAIAAFVLYAIFGVIVLRTDWPLATLGRVAQSLWNRITRGQRPPVTGLDQRLLAERATIRAVLGKNWRQAAVLTAGRLGFDYGCLLAALRATRASSQQHRSKMLQSVAITPSTGKTHLATALGITAGTGRHRVLFAAATDWITRLTDAQRPGLLPRELARLRRYGLIIAGEVGYLPSGQDAADLFFQLVSSRYEHAFLILPATCRSPAGAPCAAIRPSPPR